MIVKLIAMLSIITQTIDQPM